MKAKLALKDDTLHYTEEGKGEAFVFVHGAAASMTHGQFLATHLAKNHRFIAYSQRFHLPNNPSAPGPYNADRHAEDLLQVLDKLNITTCKIMGHSYGGSVVLSAAVINPERFSRIFLAEPSLAFLINGKTVYDDILNERNAAFTEIRSCFEQGDSAKAVSTLMNYANGARGFKAFPAEIQLDMIANASSLYRLVYETAPGSLNARALQTLTLPLDVLLGAEGNAMYKAVADELKVLLPQTRIHIIPNCAHDLVYLKEDLLFK